MVIWRNPSIDQTDVSWFLSDNGRLINVCALYILRSSGACKIWLHSETKTGQHEQQFRFNGLICIEFFFSLSLQRDRKYVVVVLINWHSIIEKIVNIRLLVEFWFPLDSPLGCCAFNNNLIAPSVGYLLVHWLLSIPHFFCINIFIAWDASAKCSRWCMDELNHGFAMQLLLLMHACIKKMHSGTTVSVCG